MLDVLAGIKYLRFFFFLDKIQITTILLIQKMALVNYSSLVLPEVKVASPKLHDQLFMKLPIILQQTTKQRIHLLTDKSTKTRNYRRKMRQTVTRRQGKYIGPFVSTSQTPSAVYCSYSNHIKVGICVTVCTREREHTYLLFILIYSYLFMKHIYLFIHIFNHWSAVLRGV